MQSRSWLAGILLLVLMNVSCSGKSESGQASTAAAPVAAAMVDAGHLGALVDLIVADAGDLPRAEFDPAALADSLGSDPQKQFEWVRDRTWWVPYRGLLRGARGVMLDRVGSNLDRAVLLGDLLRRTGHTVRLAHATLPKDRARDLIGKLRPIPGQRRSPIAPRPVSAERQRASEAIMPGFAKAVQEQIAATKRYADEAAELIRSQADQIVAKVGEVASRNEADERAAIAALQDHWWVEREEGGKWIAMDVLLPDARMGNALAAASATSEWKAGNDAPSIPETDWHTVEVRVVVERYQGGSTTESTVLETTLKPAAVLEQPITLGHMPEPWPEKITDPKTDPDALKNAALWANKWVPILQVGDEVIAQSAFTEGGDLASSSTDPVAGLGNSNGGGFGDFGSALGGGEEGVESFATAEWIDYEIRVPGESGQRLRRTVFDLLGPSRRSTQAAGFDANTDVLKLERFEALWSRTDILLQPCDFTEEFIAHLASADIIANQAAFRELAQEHDPAKLRHVASMILERVDAWGPLPDLVLWRSVLSRQPGDWFVDRPNVLNYRVGRPVVDADRVLLREVIDIASNATGVRRGASRRSFEVRLQQGVADTVAEMLTLGSDLRMAENTASVFARAAAGPDRSILIGPRDAAAAQELGWPADAAVRLAQDVDAGFVAIVPGEPVQIRGRQRVGWWRVDPASGETIGVMDTGLHAASDETSVLRSAIQGLRTFMRNNKAHTQFVRRQVGYGNPTKALRAEADLYKRIDALLKEVDRLGGF